MIKLMLLAALVFPGWTNAASQGAKPDRKPAVLEKMLPADKGCVKKDSAPLQEKSVVIATPLAQPEERCIEAEAEEKFRGVEESTASSDWMSATDPAPTTYTPAMTLRASHDNPGRIVTNEKVTRYHWVNATPKEVCKNTSSTNSFVPLYGYFLDTKTRGQIIYPASSLGLNAGCRITSITFHANGNLSAISGSTSSKVAIRFGETTAANYGSTYNLNKFQSVTGFCVLASLLTGNNTVTFVLDIPYDYNGGNLIVDVQGDGLGNAYISRDVAWYGQNQSSNYTSIYYYNNEATYQGSSTTGTVGFLPWMTIGYQVEEAYEADAPVSGDKDFFHAIEYTWPINVAEADRPADNKARLDEVATDPDQMIGMLYEIYTNPYVPGNHKRGFAENGHTEPYDDVAYTGVGAISHTGDDYTTGYQWVEKADKVDEYDEKYEYGWNIPGDVVTHISTLTQSSSSVVYYAHLDTTQYKPDQDGLTLLLIEMRDDFTTAGRRAAINAAKQIPGYTSYDVLKASIGYSFKSIRVITESMRYGTGEDAGTMFKIDCDKMNKFFMVAKGRVRYPFNSKRVFHTIGGSYTYQTFCRQPLYAYSEDQYYLNDEANGHGGWMDYNCCDFLVHMFEQFSPYDLDRQEEIKDVYQLMVNMESYGVPHDCLSIPVARASGSDYSGHYFRMYGETVDINKCQDVRDLMFFVPDMRMMNYPQSTYTLDRSVTVAEGSESTKTTSAFVPVYGYWYDVENTFNQMIYPEDMLTGLAGKQIKSITFFSKDPISFGNPEIDPGAGEITAVIGTVSQENFNNVSSYLTPSGSYTQTFTPTYGATEMTITFDEPFTYTGGNLIIHLQVTTPGSYDQTYWVGMDTENSQSLNYTGEYYKNPFLPTMKVTYEETKTSNRDSGVKYLNYNPAHRPSMALYVIRQDEVTCPEEDKHDDYYKLTLTWDSNMDEFLPASQQKYNLLQLVTDEFGVDKYIPVYYTNEYGQYLDGPNGVVLPNQNNSASWVPVVLTNIPASPDKKTYTDVYVRRTSGSQQVTYAIQGCDMDDFLSLQISNQQSYFIPGKDPAEMTLLDDVTYYSRYNPKTQRNCYSNRLVIRSNPNSIKESYFTADASNPTVIKLLRRTSVEDANPVTVATIKVTRMPSAESNGQLLLTVNQQAAKTDYPTGESDNPVQHYAGYHPNVGGEGDCNWNRSFYIRDGFVNLGALEIFDNFTVDVSENKHPAQYLYQVEFETAEEFKSLDGWTNIAYSNNYRIPIYKTDTKVNAVTLDQVLGDNHFNTDYTPGNTTFQEEVQLSSKTEILRYEAYRWPSANPADFYILDKVRTNDDEDIVPPTGMAGNQGDGYSVSMNKQGTEDYYTTSVEVSQDEPKNWAEFVDCVPSKSEAAKVFTYAPVVKLFTKGVDAAGTAHRDDYNTYGGPQQTTAVGKLEVKVEEPSKDHPLMSEYRWYMYDNNGNGNWYSYYNIYLKFDALNLPAGYELYKVRAWRRMASEDEDGNVVVDNSILGEEIETRRDVRIGQIDEDGWYMYEDINFGDQMEKTPANGQAKTMSCANLAGALLGDRPASIPKPASPDGTPGGSLFEDDNTPNPNAGNDVVVEDLVKNETRATFGALRLKNVTVNPGTLEELNAQLRVRAYFTKNTNPLAHIESSNGSLAPRRDGETVIPGSDYDYYIAEGEVDFSSEDLEQIITSINGVKMDVNCEVVEVTYVNTVGQMSRTPWQGVNIVVTRYSDGSTTTQKVIR
jgi:hypothetical protein